MALVDKMLLTGKTTTKQQEQQQQQTGQAHGQQINAIQLQKKLRRKEEAVFQ